jgi:hypothetical protein
MSANVEGAVVCKWTAGKRAMKFYAGILGMNYLMLRKLFLGIRNVTGTFLMITNIYFIGMSAFLMGVEIFCIVSFILTAGKIARELYI